MEVSCLRDRWDSDLEAPHVIVDRADRRGQQLSTVRQGSA